MKKKLAIILVAVLALTVVCLTACTDPSLKEVEGTYELTSITGGESLGVTVDAYDYFRIILDGKGNGTVEFKVAGLSLKQSSTGKYKYKNGQIEFTVKNGSTSATETYDYADGVITYVMEMPNGYSTINITLKFTRVEAQQQ